MIRSNRTLEVLLVLASVIGIGRGSAHAVTLEITRIAANASYECRRSFGFGVYDPAVNKTVTVWSGDKMSVYVKAFDHTAGTWSSSVKAKALTYTTTWDYHNYPTMVIAPDGHYLIFYFKHSTAAYMLRSPSPHSINGTWEYSTVNSDRNAYPMPVTAGGSVYLFYSRSDDIGSAYRGYSFIRSDDNGGTWSTPRKVIDTRGEDPENYDEVYLHGFTVDEDRGRICLGWEMHGGPGGHNAGGKNAYYAYFDMVTENMFSAGGTDLGTTISYSELISSCLVAEGKDSAGIPFGYTTYPAVLPDGTQAVLYRLDGTTYIARWVGGSWVPAALPGIGSVSDYQRKADGSFVILVKESGSMAVWRSVNGYSNWSKEHTGSMVYDLGANSGNAGFIDDYRPEVIYQVSTYRYEEKMTDYSGKWPVVTGGTAAVAQADTVPPSIVSVTPVGTTGLDILFSEPVAATDAGDVENFSIDKGVTVTAAAPGGDPAVVRLTVTPMETGEEYTVSVSGVRDNADPANIISGSVSMGFRYELCVTSPSVWQSTALDAQTGTFTMTWTAVPLAAECNGLFTLSAAPATDYADCAVLVRFSADGVIDARNGGDYAAVNTVTYAQGTRYDFGLSVDVAAKTYSVSVTPEGGSETVIAEDYAFRTEQAGVRSLGFWNIQDDQGSFKVCNLALDVTSGIPDNGALDDTVPVQSQGLFTLDGRPVPARLAGLQPGIYLSRHGDTVMKIMVLE